MKKAVISLLLVLILFIAGCTNLFGGTGGGTSGTGVSMRFMPDRPPTNYINENTEFQVVVELTNNGYQPVDGQLCVKDEFLAQFGGIENSEECQQFFLSGGDGADNFLTTNEKYYFPAIGNGYVYNGIVGELKTKIIADVVYNYRTVLNPQICISNNERDCNFNEIISGNALGRDALRSPVTITKIEKTITPGVSTVGVTLRMFVENVGGGRVLSGNVGVGRVFGRSGIDQKERVDFFVSLAGLGADFRCLPTDSGELILEDRKREIECNANVQIEEESVRTPVDIELVYTYNLELPTKDIAIRDTG